MINPETTRQVGQNLTITQFTVLKSLDEWYGYTHAKTQEVSRLPIEIVRRELKALVREGCVQYGPLFTEDGPACGSGYWRSAFGDSVLGWFHELVERVTRVVKETDTHGNRISHEPSNEAEDRQEDQAEQDRQEAGVVSSAASASD